MVTPPALKGPGEWTGRLCRGMRAGDRREGVGTDWAVSMLQAGDASLLMPKLAGLLSGVLTERGPCRIIIGFST